MVVSLSTLRKITVRTRSSLICTWPELCEALPLILSNGNYAQNQSVQTLVLAINNSTTAVFMFNLPDLSPGRIQRAMWMAIREMGETSLSLCLQNVEFSKR